MSPCSLFPKPQTEHPQMSCRSPFLGIACKGHHEGVAWVCARVRVLASDIVSAQQY
jgi:hypothetical protein